VPLSLACAAHALLVLFQLLQHAFNTRFLRFALFLLRSSPTRNYEYASH
jgi:hypothetical protein